jgi:hypothetical protein
MLAVDVRQIDDPARNDMQIVERLARSHNERTGAKLPHGTAAHQLAGEVILNPIEDRQMTEQVSVGPGGEGGGGGLARPYGKLACLSVTHSPCRITDVL